ncbi:MAG TPA: DNA-binding protein WhiA, partial [Clostridiales bacterium]|nr:DNA-binding protein WhiA [Clostridiales bacterium]
FKDERALRICRHALDRLEIRYHLSVRNGKKLIYIKNAAAVSDFLVRIGAVGAMLEFENSRIIKNYKNEVNRVTNCDNANLDKTVSAAMRQKTLFQKFMKTAAFEALPEQLKEIARLRVEYDSLSLKELGALLTPALGKSGVAHRLKKIEDLAKRVQ